MAITLITPSNMLDEQSKAIAYLRKKCNTCDLLCDKKTDDIFIYHVYDYLASRHIETSFFAAIAQYKEDSIMAIHVPENIGNYVVLEYILVHVEPKDTVVVFSKELYNSIEKYKTLMEFKLVLA